MQRQSLSDFPVEILGNILRFLGFNRQDLSRLLRVNKTIGSREVILRFLYQDVRIVPRDSDKFPMFLKTLYLSLRGSAYFPYHRHITKLSMYGWLDAIDLFKANTQGRLHELLDAVLQSGKLELLALSIEDFLEDLEVELTVDFTALKSLELHFPEGPHPGVNSRTWLQTMIPRMPLKEILVYTGIDRWDQSLPDFQISSLSVEVLKVYGWPISRDPFVGTKFWQTFLAPNYQTIASLTLRDVKINMSFPVELPHLKALTIWRCELEGWERLCMTLESLEELDLFDVNLLQVATENILSFFSSGVIGSLKLLAVRFISKSNRLPSPWLDAVATSLSSLVILKIDAISVETLRNVLTHCHNLMEYRHLPFDDRRSMGPTNEHLQVLSECAPVSLKELELNLGTFNSKELAEFASSFPSSVESLNLSGSRSLTTFSVRALFRLSLRKLSMRGVNVQPEHQSELELILQTERPVNLKQFIWNFDSSYSYYRNVTTDGRLKYGSWDE